MKNTRALHTPPVASSPVARCPAAPRNTSAANSVVHRARAHLARLPARRVANVRCPAVLTTHQLQKAKTTCAPGMRQTHYPHTGYPSALRPRKCQLQRLPAC